MPLDRHADTWPRVLRNWQRLETDRILGEVPAGAVNGSNVTFTLTENPAAGIALFKNGLRLALTTDYTIDGKTITMTSAPSGGAVLLVDYIF